MDITVDIYYTLSDAVEILLYLYYFRLFITKLCNFFLEKLLIIDNDITPYHEHYILLIMINMFYSIYFKTIKNSYSSPVLHQKVFVVI